MNAKTLFLAAMLNFERVILGFITLLLIVICIQLYGLPKRISHAAPDPCGGDRPCWVKVDGTVQLNEYTIGQLQQR